MFNLSTYVKTILIVIRMCKIFFFSSKFYQFIFETKTVIYFIFLLNSIKSKLLSKVRQYKIFFLIKTMKQNGILKNKLLTI